MKQRQSKEWVGIIGMPILGMSILIGTAGCGRRFQAGQSGAQSSSALQATDLAKVSETAANIQRDDPALIAAEISEGKLVLRTEHFTNPNDAPVRIWMQAGDSVTAWGMCTIDAGQYDSSLSAPQLRSPENLTELSQEPNGWVSFELPANGTAKVQWVVGGTFSWVPGPWPAPNVDCNQSFPERGWSQFKLTGTLFEQVRISPLGIEADEAAGDERNLKDPSRVWMMPKTQDSLDLRVGC